MSELAVKLDRIYNLLERHSISALLLQRVENFAWASCGAASHINLASSFGNASLLITPAGRFVLTDGIECPRLEQEERLSEQGWEFQVAPWYESSAAFAALTRGFKLGADAPYPDAVDLSAALPALRAQLTPEEQGRYRNLGDLCAQAMEVAVHAVRPGMTEHEIAGLLSAESLARGVSPIVNLIATDERVFRFRHPLPTEKKLEAYAMLVLCGRMSGLVCSITRLVHFGRLPSELRRKADAVARIDAGFIAATRPGRRLCDILAEAIESYEAEGFQGEWQHHHQGGLAGYLPREIVATPRTQHQVAAGEAYAWNPSIAGAKSEDTILVGPTGNEVLTAIPGWPAISVSMKGQVMQRPAILEVL